MAVCTPTTEASRAHSLAVAAAVPQNMHVSSFYACMEWWRVKATTMKKSNTPFSVLSIANGSADYDRVIITSLATVRPKLAYTILQPSQAHSKLNKDGKTKRFVTLSESKSFDEFVETFRAAGSGKKRKKRGGGSTGFDIVHVALWRNHEWEDTLAVLRTATELLKDNGTLVVFRFGMDDGVFKLRKRFAGRLGPKPKTCADFPDEDVMTLMSQTRMLPRVELLRSMVDVSSLVTFKPSPFVYHSMSDILQCDMETAASKDATLLSEVSSALLDSSVASHPERCVVYTPLHVIIGSRGASAPFAPVTAAEAITQPKVEPWWPHGQKGGFLNIGLQNWHNVRKQWKSYDTDSERLPKPPLIAVDEVMDGLSRLRRTYTLPAPLALSDILDIFIDIWDDEDMR